MEITAEIKNARAPVTLIHINGNIDSSNFHIFQTKSEELIAQGTRHILVNLEKASFISSAGLRAIHNIFNKLRSHHKDMDDDALRKSMSAGAYKSPYLKVANLSNSAKEVFELGGFDTYIEVYNDLEEALASY